jgi:hypothetical protein
MGTLVGAGQQQKRFPLYCADGSITTGGTPQLVLPRLQSRSLLKLQNTSAGPLWFEFGSARATATITAQTGTPYSYVSSVAVTNAGFNFTKPPVVIFYGGGQGGNGSYLGLNQFGGPAPDATLRVSHSRYAIDPHPAKAHCVMTGTAPNLSVSSIIVDDPGMGYVIAPNVFLMDSDLDPYGCAVPSVGVGMLLPSGSAPLLIDSTSCHTDAISVFGATTGQTFFCRWMP